MMLMKLAAESLFMGLVTSFSVVGIPALMAQVPAGNEQDMLSLVSRAARELGIPAALAFAVVIYMLRLALKRSDDQAKDFAAQQVAKEQVAKDEREASAKRAAEEREQARQDRIAHEKRMADMSEGVINKFVQTEEKVVQVLGLVVQGLTNRKSD